jgi:hypothetical protein
MKKEDLIKGKKYKLSNGDVFTFEEFDENGNPCFLDEGQGFQVNKKRLIYLTLDYVLENFTPIEEPENDLNLSVGDSVYLGRVEFKCSSSDNSHFPYRLKHLKSGSGVWITKDGRLAKNTPPIFSLEPYDLPEMVYEKPIQVGEMVFAWDYEYEIESKYISYGQYKGKSEFGKYKVGVHEWNFISKTSPFDETN